MQSTVTIEQSAGADPLIVESSGSIRCRAPECQKTWRRVRLVFDEFGVPHQRVLKIRARTEAYPWRWLELVRVLFEQSQREQVVDLPRILALKVFEWNFLRFLDRRP